MTFPKKLMLLTDRATDYGLLIEALWTTDVRY